MTPEEYGAALAEAGDGITAHESLLRRLAARAPDEVEREEVLAAADALSATKRRLRARALERGARTGPLTGEVTVGPLTIDRAAMRVTLHGRPLPLSRKEFGLLSMLASDPSRAFDKDALARDVWGYPAGIKSRTVDSHACRLRQKLGGGGWVENVWGVGYRLRAPEEVVADV